MQCHCFMPGKLICACHLYPVSHLTVQPFLSAPPPPSSSPHLPCVSRSFHCAGTTWTQNFSHHQHSMQCGSVIHGYDLGYDPRLKETELLLCKPTFLQLMIMTHPPGPRLPVSPAACSAVRRLQRVCFWCLHAVLFHRATRICLLNVPRFMPPPPARAPSAFRPSPFHFPSSPPCSPLPPLSPPLQYDNHHAEMMLPATSRHAANFSHASGMSWLLANPTVAILDWLQPVDPPFLPTFGQQLKANSV